MRGADFVASVSFERLAREIAGGSDAGRAELSRQRRALVDAATAPSDRVAVPAHASRDLVDDVKACGRAVVFAPIAPNGSTDVTDIDDVAAVWHQTVAGVHAPGSSSTPADPVDLVDAHDTVMLRPAPGVASLELSDGAPGTHAASDIVALQRDRVAAVETGLRQAAALPIVSASGDATDAGPIPTGVVVRLPAAADPLTFAAYAQAELTNVDWFAMRRPLHPQARHRLTPEQLGSSLDHLARLVIVPVSPFATDEEIGHAVLGIVKTAEYTGWRWHDDPEHAGQYARWISERYGVDHEAYRPAFETGRPG